MEIYKKISDIKGFEGFIDYYISNYGNIKSYKSDKNGRILKLSKRCGNSKTPYLVISLRNVDTGKFKKFSAHRLVLLAFQYIENHDDMTVNHIDECKTNNHVDNLEWMTASDNLRYSKLNKTYITDNPDSLIEYYNNSSKTLKEIADELNVPFNSLYNVISKMGNKVKLTRKRFLVTPELEELVLSDISKNMKYRDVMKKRNISHGTYFNIKRKYQT